jgi:hypothetical protein
MNLRRRTTHKLSFILFASFLFGLTGCGQPLRTLMDLGAEQDAQQVFVSSENKRFEALLRAAKRGKIRAGMSRTEVVNRYGEPILIKEGIGKMILLYRRPAEFLNPAKVYLEFDAQGFLTAVRIEENIVQSK